jgi:hypothetical protein
MEETRPTSIAGLITIPALITLGITILRLVGELEHWPKPWFSAAAGGGAAIVGISWLPIIFGPYFAVKLAGAGEGPPSVGKAIGLALAGFVVVVLGGVIAGIAATKLNANLAVVGFLVILVAGFIARVGWHSLGNVLFAYAFAARVPVLIVMFIAMNANGGQGWGTHYDVVPPNFHSLAFAVKFFYFALVPQMTLWIGFTVVVGSIFGAIAAAVAGRRKPAVAPAA